MTHQDNIYNYNKAWRFYSEGIKLQMDYESIKDISEDDALLLENIRQSNQKLYEYMRALRSELRKEL